MRDLLVRAHIQLGGPIVLQNRDRQLGQPTAFDQFIRAVRACARATADVPGRQRRPACREGIPVGIVSWSEPCATGKPDVFTSVATYFDWISSTMR